MTRFKLRCAAIVVGIVLIAHPAWAGYSIAVYVDFLLAYTAMDNVLGSDVNPIVGEIEHHFSLSDAANRWQANGVIFGEGGYDGALPVSTVVTDTLIQKIANVPITGGRIDFRHHYAASGLQTHSASIDGVFDNEVDHEVRGASLDYSADVTGYDLGSYVTGLYAGPGPHAFMGSLGPIVTPTTIEHHIGMSFYLDTLGDSIELFDSVELHTVPEPAGGLVLAGLGAILSRRRRTASSKGAPPGKSRRSL